MSAPPLDSLNLGLSVNDRPEAVLENRRRLCAAIGVPQERLVVPGQVHGTTLRWVGEAEAGRGAFDSPSVIKEHDGLLTAAAGLGLVISYADCVPIVIVADGEEGPAFATVHAGWRGMIAGIGGMAAARALGEAAACSQPPSDPASAPAASPSTTSCGAGSRPATRAPPAPGRSTSGTLPGSTWSRPACRRTASTSPACAPSSDARFFSHRRDQGATGRHLAIAWRQEA